MAKKNNKDFSTFGGFNFGFEIKKCLQEFQDEIMSLTDEGLDKAEEFIKDKLIQATPFDETNFETKHLKESWLSTRRKYRGVRYVGTSKVNENNVPIIAVLEFSSRGKPFVRKTFEANKEELYKIIKEEISK